MKKQMTMHHCAASAALGLGLAAASGFAAAAVIETFTFNAVSSVGVQGDSANDIRTVTPNSSYTVGRIDFEGTVSPVADEVGEYWTWGEELWIRIGAGVNVYDFQLGSGDLLAPDTTFSGSFDFFGGLDVTPDTELSFEFYEDIDDKDGADDAIWSSISFSLSDELLSLTDLGVAGFAGDLFDINTLGSDFDTQLGLYDAIGYLVGSNDDVDTSSNFLLQSQLALPLDAGQYFVAASGWNTAYADGFGVTVANNSEAGSLALSVNGLNATAPLVPLASGEVAWYSFDVAKAVTVPEPGTLALLSLGLAGLGWRRSARTTIRTCWGAAARMPKSEV